MLSADNESCNLLVEVQVARVVAAATYEVRGLGNLRLERFLFSKGTPQNLESAFPVYFC